MYWPPAADFFRLSPLDPTRWGVVLAATAVALLACVVLDRAVKESPADVSPRRA
jgi:hypothetical protein